MFVNFEIFIDSDKTQRQRDKCNGGEEALPETALSKEQVLRKIVNEWLEEEKIFGFYCIPVDNDLRRKFSFQAIKADVDCLYERLTYNGFGAPGSRSVVMTNDNQFCEGNVAESEDGEDDAQNVDLVKCLKSIQSQLTVHEVLANVRAKGKASMDSVFQVITAGMIAMTGLAMNDPVIVVASMFIAPLMDVINMVTFAIRIQSKTDIVMGAKIFFSYIAIMMTMAFAFAKPVQEWARIVSLHMYGEAPMYPTEQMTNRGHHFSLIGVFVLAVCSSLSSYSSMLNGYNFNVHIGNAISLSLVPPVMNAGMMIVFGVDTAIFFSGAHINSTDPCLRTYALCVSFDKNPDFNSSLAACVKTSHKIEGLMKAHVLNSNRPKICCYPRVAFEEALISLSITFLTALIVILMGLALMWMKKFTPSRLDQNHVSEFYKNDLDTYVHDAHTTVRQRSTPFFIQGLRSELQSKNLNSADCDMALELAQRTQHFQSISAALGNTITKYEMEVNRETPLRQRVLKRQISENQRTIYNTFVGSRLHDFGRDSTIATRIDPVHEKCDESNPLRGSRSVGRFEITCPEAHSPSA